MNELTGQQVSELLATLNLPEHEIQDYAAFWEATRTSRGASAQSVEDIFKIGYIEGLLTAVMIRQTEQPEEG